MDESDFHQLLDTLLEHLVEAIENADTEGDIDAEYHDGIMEVELKDGAMFVINKHSPTQQLWMSSPRSGARHFAYNETTKHWVDTRSDAEFYQTFINDFGELTGIHIE